MRVIDLSWPIADGMPVFPGDPAPSVKRVMTAEKDGAAVSLLTLGSHTGTHMDAPAHMAAGGRTLDELPCESFFGLALVADVSKLAGRRIERADITAPPAGIGSVDFLLLYTGWSAKWGDASYTRGSPALSEDAALWLAALKLKGVGVDAMSLDEAGSETCRVHKILLGSGLLIIENMRNLELLTAAGTFCFAALPLPFKNADGAPVRAAAVLE